MTEAIVMQCVLDLPLELQELIYQKHTEEYEARRQYFREHVLSHIQRPVIYHCIDDIYNCSMIAMIAMPAFTNYSNYFSIFKVNSAKGHYTIDSHQHYLHADMFKQWAIDSIWQFEKKYKNPHLGRIVISPKHLKQFAKIIGSTYYNPRDLKYIYRFNAEYKYLSDEWSLYNNGRAPYINIDYYYSIINAIYKNICKPYLLKNVPHVEL